MPTWSPYNSSLTINTSGSEGGIILNDEELDSSARITMEKDTDIAPFAITMGIYGLAFHTNYYSSMEDAEEGYDWYKGKVEEIVSLYSVPESERDTRWEEQQNQLLEDLIHR